MKIIILFSSLFIFGIFSTGKTAGVSTFGDDTARFCIVTGEIIESGSVKFTYLGRKFEVCCDGCQLKFQKEPARYMKEGIVCLPCNDDDWKKDISHVHNGVKYYFCGNGCKSEFEKDAEKYLSKFNE
jgi:YHS domain-containing protein